MNVHFFLCFTHWSKKWGIYRDYCHYYTHPTWCHPISFERYTLPLHAYVFPNAVPYSPPFLRRIHFNVSLLVGVCQHALTKLATSCRLFHVASWFHALSTCIELQNTITYGSSSIERPGSAYEQRAKTYRTTFIHRVFLTILEILVPWKSLFPFKK